METSNAIYFWTANNKYGFLSNFNIDGFRDNGGFKYLCNEQFFMIQKCLLFDPKNTELLEKMIDAKAPYIVKKLGRNVNNFNPEVWNKKKYFIMKRGLTFKFSQNKSLKRKLLETDNKKLYEASRFDNIWGIGINSKDAMEIDPSFYPGQNLLGKALMEVRDELRKSK